MSKKDNAAGSVKKNDAANSSLRKLKRKDLLAVMLRQQQHIEELEDKVRYLEEKLRDREIAISEMGSVAEASLKLNEIFEAAQKAADQYIENARIRAQRSESGNAGSADSAAVRGDFAEEAEGTDQKPVSSKQKGFDWSMINRNNG